MSSQPDSSAPPRPTIPRRELFSAATSGMLGFLSACGPAGSRTEVLQTPEGKVFQWERDDLLVLVSGLQDRYQVGQEIRLKVLLNNQSNKFGQFRLRTKLAGRGEQVVVEAPVASIQVKPLDAAETERVLPLTSAITPGEYTVVVELPPWNLEGRTTGGGSLSAAVRVER
jgi:hypothetical protein